MTGDGSSRDGKVGYKRPPIRTRFQKGRSGNPRGRQKGVRNFAADLKRSLEIPVTLNDQGRAKRVSTQEALVLRQREKALKGDHRALEWLLNLARMQNNDEGERSGGQHMAPEDQAILNAFVEDVLSRPPASVEPTPDPPEKGEIGGDG
jgi:hypothetical protein